MAKKPCDCDSGKMTFQQWAAAGGAVPTSYKGREKAWANQVKKYAAGGEAKMQAGGIAKLAKLLKGTQETLPAAQREANLQKMLAESKAPMRLYHGTMASEGGKGQEAIRKLKPSKEGALGSGVYLTPQSEFASTYAGFPARSQLERDIETGSDFAKKSARQMLDRMNRGAIETHEVGGNMLPVYAQMKNPLVLDGSMGRDPMIEALVKLGMNKDAAGKMVENAYERKGYIGKEVESRARAAGYDGLMQYRDGNLSEVVSYNPNAVKSAIGNKGTYDTSKPDLNEAGGGLIKGAMKALKGSKKADDAAKSSLGEVGSMVTKMGEEGRSPIVPVPNRWFLYPDKFPHQQKMVERVLATTGKKREDFPSGAFIDPRTGEVLDSRIMNELGVVIDPKTNRPMMSAKGESGIEVIDPKLGAYNRSNLVRKGLFKPEGGDPLLNDLNFLATIEKGDVGHKYGLATEYASPAELFNTNTGANPTLRPRSRGDLFGVGDVVGQVRVGRSEPHDVYEKLFVAPKGSDVQGVKLSKAKGGEVKMADGGKVDKPYIGYRRAGRRPESQQDRAASANIPVAVARGLVSGTLGMPGDLESLARLPYELITGNESPTILPTSGDIEKRLPFRGASQTPVGQMFTGASQLAGGAYTGPLSGARAVMAVPRAIKRAGQDFAMASTQGVPKMFIGPKAKTWDKAKADAAARMEQEGRDPVDIWRQTGTFRGADGIQRQEISDVGAVHRNPDQIKELGKQKKQEAQELQQRIVGTPGQKDMFPKALTEAKKPAREEVKRLKQESEDLLYRNPEYRGHAAQFVLDHPELYKAYPELADVNVLQGGRGGGAQAAFSDLGGKGGMEIDLYESGLRSNPRSSLLHEMQHAVQSIEGANLGGSPRTAFANPEARTILESIRKRALEPMSFEAYAKHLSHIPEEQLPKAYEKYVKDIPNAVKAMDREFQSQAAMEYYKRLAGEAEARATQAREPMSASQRAQEFPYSSYDVLPEDLIVKQSSGPVSALQTVYHGSPHKFDKFDSSKIGTGEGAQAYGHGLYFAESPGVASDYKRKLSDTLNVKGDATDLERRAAQMALTFGDNTSEGAVKWLSKYEGKGAEHTSPAMTPELIQSVKQKFSEGTFSPGGHLYTIDLPDEKIARMLDWDKPLSEQPEVIKALKGTDYEVGMSQRQAEKIADQRLREEADEWAEMTGGDPVDYSNNVDWESYVDRVRKESGSIDSSITGKDLHRMVMRDEGYRPDMFDTENYQVGTSEALRGYGIPGVKYLDRQSRQAGEGSRNFVVFPGEEDALTILERKKAGGEVKMAGGGAAFGIYPKQRATPSSEETKKRVKQASEVGADLFLPKDAVDVGMMLLPGGKAARKLGAALIAGGASTEAEAGVSAIKAALAKLGKFATERDLKKIKDAGQAAYDSEAALRAAKDAEIAKKIKAMPARSKKSNIEMGLYHPVGGGAKLSKPFEAMHSTRVPNPTVGNPQVNILTPEDLYRQQAAMYPLVGDKADTGTFLTHIGKKELEVPVGLGGGPRYMDVNLNPANLYESAAWESGTGRVTSLGNQAQRAGESGRPVFGVYTAGSGKNTDFNIMGANAILQQIPQSKFTKKTEKAFDEEMRSIFSGWPGIRSEKAEDILLDKNQGELRKSFINLMGSEPYQKAGMPDVPATRKAIMDPQLYNTPTNESGFRIARMDPTGRIIENPLQPSDYPTAMAGELAGKLNQGVDYKDMFSSHFNARRLLGQPESGDYYSFSRAHPIQYADQEWLDRIMQAQEKKNKIIKTGSYAKGGKVGGLSQAKN